MNCSPWICVLASQQIFEKQLSWDCSTQTREQVLIPPTVNLTTRDHCRPLTTSWLYIVFAVLLDHRPKISEQFVSLRLVSFLLFFFFAAHHTWSHHPWQSLMLLILLVPYSLRFSGPQGRFGSDFLSSSGIMLVPGALQNLVVTSGKPMASSKVCFQLGQKQFCKLMSFSQVAVSRRLMKFFFID